MADGQERNAVESGTLYLVSTPIGNLEDITLRALKVLNAVDVIACEDTRHSLKLLNYYKIKKRLVAYHSYNERNSSFGLVQLLEQGNSVAVITDGGTPCISDPGVTAVRACIEAGFSVVAVPGATAVIPALVVSGMRTDTFHFFGFLSCKGGKRRHELEAMRSLDGTLVLYESTHRIFKLLADIAEIFPHYQVCVCKEISKINEKVYRGTAAQLLKNMEEDKNAGEYVVMIANYLLRKKDEAISEKDIQVE
ncbi:MAG: 16S rRNA (cytidine(1402)-2'-O)-methyltransferase [Spirochaetales bacterium]|nr:16S rRNA (cytidine(1402)-2'-O)-methyltransferase [Spirochaetales bacterium]